MGVKIYIPADEVWLFFQNNRERCEKEMIAIAENEETQYAAYITESCDYPLLCICKGDNDPEYEEGVINREDCAETVKRCLLKYLFPIIVKSGSSSLKSQDDDDLTVTEEELREEWDEKEYERHDELWCAMMDFLDVALRESRYNKSSDLGDKQVNEILEYVLDYLATEQEMDIYHPMILTDEKTGEDVFVEYPYDTDSLLELMDDDPYYGCGGWV